MEREKRAMSGSIHHGQEQEQEEEEEEEEEESTKQRAVVADPTTFARSYQLEALEKAIKENTIVYLETGSGKTLIAIMLLRSYAHLLRKPSPFVAVFMVPTVVLVTQQAGALEMHTDLKVGKYWGEMGVDYWDAKVWKKELEKYEVFVMTPRILLDAFRHSFFKLDILKLLIFDECHNARGRSDYACIMREFYHPCLHSGSTNLPRILGMTASPIKSKGLSSSTVYGKHILELENLMNSKVYTVVNESVLAEFIPFSTPKLKFYKDLGVTQSILSLHDQLTCLKEKHVEYLKKLNLEDSVVDSAKRKINKAWLTFRYCVSDLGIWLAYKAAHSLSSAEIGHYFWGPNVGAIDEGIVRNFSQGVLQLFSVHIPPGSSWRIGDDIVANLDAGLLSAKVSSLIESLTDYRTIKEIRCIIFVERAITAIVLQVLLNQLSVLSGWNTAYMAGNHSGLQCQSRKEQIEIIDEFRKGTVNIIVATQILEEGLDVQSCNLVIRFDISTTVCSFIQSRGRARMEGSDYVLFVRSGDTLTLAKVNEYLVSGDVMRKESLRYASLPCAPPEIELDDEEFYRVETTGAIVTLSSSVALIYYYCSQLPSDRYFRPAPRFSIDKESKLCNLYLPKSCPIQIVIIQGETEVLKKLVCLEACRKLHQIGALTDNLLPEFAMKYVDGFHFGDMIYDNEQVDYFPGELICHEPSLSEELYYCYSIILKQNLDYEYAFRNIVLAVKDALECDVTDTDSELLLCHGSVNMQLVYSGTVHLTSEQVLECRRFQITVLRLLIDRSLYKLKDAIADLQKKDNLPRVDYLLLPSNCCNSSLIDWDCVRSSMFLSSTSCCDEQLLNYHCLSCDGNSIRYVHIKSMMVCKCILVNSLIYTPHNGYMYCINRILDDMNGNSCMKLEGDDYLTYKDYYKSRHGIYLQHDGESLLCGRHVFTVQNWLQRRNHQNYTESNNAWVQLPPELCVIIMSPISINTLYSYSLVPSIMHRLESVLLALNLKKLIVSPSMQNMNVSTMKVVEAITTKKCQEEISLESLETLGDSFLKYAVSQQLFKTNTHHHEGLLSAHKERIVSNNALCKLACDRKLQGFIRHECFDPKEWTVPGDFSQSSKVNEISLFSSGKVYVVGKRHMKSKVVADVVEGLIGAYLISGGELAAMSFMKWLGMEFEIFDYVATERQFLRHPERCVNVTQLESMLKYSFLDASLLVEALTHGSYQLPDVPGCYQRLEFLGDSVLDHLITVHMYTKYPGMSPGQLTELRSSSVNNDCYALAAVKAGLHKHILHTSSELYKQIQIFVDKTQLLPLEYTFGWESETTVPKVLGDVIESLAGAIFVDCGYNKDIVWECIRPILEPLVTPDTVRPHPVKELDELCQQNSYKNQMSVSCVDNMTEVTVEVTANGKSFRRTCAGINKKTAKRLAARAVLEALRSNVA